MQSKKSCFNGPVFRKNLTRFAPAWLLYGLCLVLGILLLYSNGGTMKQWHFAANLTEMPQVVSFLNLIYAPIVAQLVFGDLFSSRMCNALHAMPIRRESWYVTHILSGLSFAAIPTLVMSILATVLSTGSIIENAWQIPWLIFAASMLEFVCFFGIAALCVMCAGNRLTMVLLYALVNAGAYITFWLIDTVYTPMLYGVITPSTLAETLTPIGHMVDNAFLRTPHAIYDLREIYGDKLEGAVSTFIIVTESWNTLLIWAGVGIGFTLVGLVLYKNRDLECAGDALAFRILEPAFQVLGALVAATAAQFLLHMFTGVQESNYLFLISGLVVGWFACRMLIERSTRVFRLRSWLGLAGLAVALAVSLLCTHLDVFGIETWQPKLEDIESAKLSTAWNYEYTEEEDLQKILDMQSEALSSRLEDSGNYIQDENGQWVRFTDYNVTVEEREKYSNIECRKAFHTTITYTLKNGKLVQRNYCIWSDGQAGDNARNLLSRWEVITNDRIYENGLPTEERVLDRVMQNPEGLYIEGLAEEIEAPDRALLDSLLAAVQADCEEGNMAQYYYLHNGHFRKENPDSEAGYYYRGSLQVNLSGGGYGVYLDIFPECRHTLKWLEDHGWLAYEIFENNLAWY